MSIRIDDLLKAVQGELAEYANEVTEDVKESVKDVAKETVKEVKRRSPVRSGAYKKSWGQTQVYDGPGGIRIVIHNKKHYRLTHLLEKGHALRNGGRTRAFPHIEPAERLAERELQQEVELKIKG